MLKYSRRHLEVNRVGPCQDARIHPLHVAASCGSEWMTRLLLERGACFDIRDSRRNTPLDIAIVRRQQGPFGLWLSMGHHEDEM
jgi:hypothetical protein